MVSKNMSLQKKEIVQQKKYLVEITHPHFVHFFGEVIHQLGVENVVIAGQDSGIITKLLRNKGFDFVLIGRKYNGIFNKAFGQLIYLLRFIRLIRKYRVCKALGMSPALAFASRLTGTKLYLFDDDDSAVQPVTKKVTIPLSSFIITPQCLAFENYGKKHITYKGFQELAYLSPRYFKPDPAVLTRYHLEKNKYVIIRLNDFHAHHDIGHSGIPKNIRQQLIDLFKTNFSIYITSEGDLEEEFKPFQLMIDPVDIHHVMFYAYMYIGDSQTMASEAAVLGTPSIRCNTFKNKIAYLNELEYKYGLTYAFLPNETDEMFRKINSLLAMEDLKQVWSAKKENMLKEMEDVPGFISSFIRKENTNQK
jgi:uncharacterized protein